MANSKFINRNGDLGGESFGPSLKFGLENLLLFFNLLPLNPETDPNQLRHMFGFGHPALLPLEKDFLFLILLR